MHSNIILRPDTLAEVPSLERWDRQLHVMAATTDEPATAFEVAQWPDELASNARAHRFYRRPGFEPVGHHRFGNDDCLVHELRRQDWTNSTASRATRGS